MSEPTFNPKDSNKQTKKFFDHAGIDWADPNSFEKAEIFTQERDKTPLASRPLTLQPDDFKIFEKLNPEQQRLLIDRVNQIIANGGKETSWEAKIDFPTHRYLTDAYRPGMSISIDDVTIISTNSSVGSRQHSEMSSNSLLTHDTVNPWFIFPANMATVTSTEMFQATIDLNPAQKFIGDRFPREARFGVTENSEPETTMEWFDAICGRIDKFGSNLIQSIGTSHFRDNPRKVLEQVKEFKERGLFGVCIDIAHAGNLTAQRLCHAIKYLHPEMKVIIGNITNPVEYLACCDAGADAAKILIGPGSGCSTREEAGVGMPGFTAAFNIWLTRIAREADPDKQIVPIIYDGGIKRPGDIPKVNAISDHCMLGGELAEVFESGAFMYEALEDLGIDLKDLPDLPPGEIDTENLALYLGQASGSFKHYYYGRANGKDEGVGRWIRKTMSYEERLKLFVGGLQSALTYVNARNVIELRENILFSNNTESGRDEGKPKPCKI